MHKDLPSSVEMPYVHALKRAEAHFQGRSIRKWALFAGTGVSIHFGKAVERFLMWKYNINLHSDTVVAAEIR